MHIGSVNQETQHRLIEIHLSQTEKALVEVFGLGHQVARDVIEVFRGKLSMVPMAERIFLLHRDPLALAADLSGNNLDLPQWQEAIKRFNNLREPLFHNPFQLL